MAKRLVPYIQDEQRWIKYYMAQARKQIKPKVMKLVKGKPVQPSVFLPKMQMAAQTESELKCQQNEAPVFTPIKATPEFESIHSTSVTAKGRIRKHKAKEEENCTEQEKVICTFKRHFQLIINHG